MRATVVVPTYDHGPLIEHAVGSALAQTETDLEVLIVGDGVPAAARPFVERVVESDPRIRFLDRPKGAGHGFRHRDEAILDARGDVILYLSDDDLWLPDHAELLCTALETAEFVASFPFGVTLAGVRLKVPHDLARPHWQRHLQDGRSMISLSAVGHSRALYSQLETGWRRDDSNYSAVWRDFALHTVRMATVPKLTSIILPDSKRRRMSPEERLRETAHLAGLARHAEGRLDLYERLLEYELVRWSRLTLGFERLRPKEQRRKRRAERTSGAADSSEG
jgi:GalNAc5-diNAcBac-PP-undecaprenol beta-1,3-glucosyltransferase